MSDHATDANGETATEAIRRLLTQVWRDVKSVYYANTPIWRVLKSAGLVFIGFFLWAGSNLLHSFQSSWWFLYYPMAYGFLLLVWGPFTHLVIVPTAIRWRRETDGERLRWLARHASKLNLSVFFAAVLLLGTAPVGPMTLDFDVAIGEDDSDVNPTMECTATDEVVRCQVSEHEGYQRVVVKSGGDRVATVDQPPYEFEVPLSELSSGVNGRRLTVELRDTEGDTVRRYIRTFQAS